MKKTLTKNYSGFRQIFRRVSSVMKLITILLISGTLIASASLEQPRKDVTGKVIDQKGAPLPGVSIVVKETTIGTITNMEGTFQLNIPADAQTLVFSFLGMKTQEIPVGVTTIFNVTLEEETFNMDELVVVGYGTQRRSEITGSIATVSGDKLEKIPVQNIGKALTGMAPGLRVFDVDGDPSRDPVIQIRGESTASISGGGGDTQPLIVIDGSPGGSLRDVPPDDIQSIEILKDAAAAAIYGSRGANGVILIQTRRGQKGAVRVNFDSFYKYNMQVSKAELARPYDHVVMNAEGQIADNRGLTPRGYHTIDWLKEYPYIDYMENLFRNTWSQKQRMSVSGGSEDHKFRLSGTFEDEPGTTIHNEYKQGTFLFSSDHNIGKRLKWSNTLTYRTNKQLRGYDYEPRRRLLDMVLPYQTAVDRNDPDYFIESLEWDDDWGEFQKSQDRLVYRNIYSFNVNPTFTIMEGLELSNRFVYRQTNTNEETYTRQATAFGRVQSRNTAQLTYGNGYNIVNDVILNFNRSFFDGRHSVYATAVYSAEKSSDRYLRAYRADMPLDMILALRLGDVGTQTNDAWYFDDTRVGMVGRIGYTYDNRYVLAASVRRDASSRFTPANRWGTFPSVSFAWNLHNESFMQNIDWISNARLRASWGQLGRDKLARYRHYSMVTLAYGYAFNNSPTTGAAVGRLAYEGTGWESVETIDVGAEGYFFNNRLKAAYTIWTKTTNDLIFPESLPAYSGLRNLSVDVNAGELLNSGHELELEWRSRVGELSYNVSSNFSTYKSEVISWVLPEGYERITGRDMGLGSQRDVFAIEPGYPLMFFYVLETNGLWQNDAEIDEAKYHQKDTDGNFMYNADGDPIWGWPGINRERPQPGSVKFVDRDGDGNIHVMDDRYHAGQRYPKLVIGLNAGFEYKGFDFFIQTNAHFGHSIFHELDRRNSNAFAERRVAVDLTAYQTWIGEGSTNEARTPRLSNAGQTNFTRPADHGLYKADYFRIKAMNIGYTVKSTVMQKLGISSVRIYASGYNLMTFTKYPGFDPEIGGDLANDSYSYAGFYRGYPYYNPRSYTGGVQLNF